MKNVAIIALVAAAGAASANTISASQSALQSANPLVTTGSPTGSSFAISVSAIAQNGDGSTAGVAGLVRGDVPSFGTPATFPQDAGLGPFGPGDSEVTSSVTPLGGNDFRLIVDIRTLSGLPFVQGGLSLGGQPINGIILDLGDIFNSPSFPAPTDAVDFGDSVNILAEDVEIFDSIGSVGAFPLAGAGTPGFGGGITDYADQILLSIPAGGDLFGSFDINQATFTIDYSVIPAPASAGLLGLGGLVAVRRRR